MIAPLERMTLKGEVGDWMFLATVTMKINEKVNI